MLCQTTLVICIQVVVYLSLDMFRLPWTFSADNRNYRRAVILTTLAAGVLAPVWSFPALLKVVLLMGVNVLVIPLVIITMIYLVNRRVVMGQYTASPIRNGLLALCLAVSVALAVEKAPHYLEMLKGFIG